MSGGGRAAYHASMRFTHSAPLALLPGCVLLLAACSGSKPEASPAAPAVTTAVATVAAVAATMAATATPVSTASAASASAATLVALNGLRCQGQWRNQSFGSTGAFSARVESAAGGGVITFEVGGNLFGASGGVFQAPFRVSGNSLVIDQRSDFLGQVQASIELGGKATATMTAPPALGPGSKVTLTEYTYGPNGLLKFALNIDFGGGRSPASSTVEAACAKP